MIMATIQSKLKTSGEALPDFSSLVQAILFPRWQDSSPPCWGHMLCLSDGQKGPRMQKAVAWSSGGSGSTTPTAQLACAALPAPGEPARLPHLPPGSSSSGSPSPPFSKGLLPAFCPASLLLWLMAGPRLAFCLGAVKVEHL